MVCWRMKIEIIQILCILLFYYLETKNRSGDRMTIKKSLFYMNDGNTENDYSVSNGEY